ncbi:MAG: C25 family cysteine peptidase [Bacteroidota bacterium]
MITKPLLRRNIYLAKIQLCSYFAAAVFFLLPCGASAQDHPWTPSPAFLDTLRSWNPSSARALRFDVHTDGLLRIDGAWLRAAGTDPATLIPSQIKLVRLGKEIPLVRQGLEDGSFDDGDYLVFFGERPYDGPYRLLPAPDGPYPERLYRYADSTAYWLLLDGDPAAILPTRPFLSPASNDTLDWLYQTVHIEEDRNFTVFGANIDRVNSFGWSAEKTWIQAILARESALTLPFVLPVLQEGEPAYYTIKLAGYQGEPAVSPNHSVRLRVGTAEPRDSIQFDPGEQVLFAGVIPPGELTEGANDLRIESVPRVARYSAVAFDWADLDYPCRLDADNGVLKFHDLQRAPEGKHLLALQGFTSPDLLTLSRRGGSWAKLEPRVVADGAGGYTLLLCDTLTEHLTIVASEIGRIPAAPIGRLHSGSDPLARSADYLILTHGSLLPAASSYASFIAGEYGVSTAVVDVKDVYDAFSYGMFNPEALRLYLRTLSRLGRAPRFLFLAGDANIDYKRLTGSFRENLVPSYGNPASDCALASFDEDGTAQEFPVGRLPVRLGSELEAYQQRHQKYRDTEPDIWNKTSIHFSGGEYYENDTELSYYRNINLDLIENLVRPAPFAGRATHFYKTAEPPSDFGPVSEQFVRDRIAEGGLFISYVGHSATTTWDNSISDPAQLANASGRGSLITDFGCSSARFAEPDVASFAEKCVVPVNAQAIAYIGNAAFGYRASSASFPRIFYRQLLQDGIHDLGEAHRRARKELLDTYGRNQANLNAVTMSTLIGDPIFTLAIAELPDFTFPENAVQPLNELLTDAVDTLRFKVAVENTGRGENGSLGMSVTLLEGSETLSAFSIVFPFPLLLDTITVAVPSPRRAGSFQLQLVLDPESRIEESREDNNTVSTSVLLLSSQFAVANAFPALSSGDWSKIRLLNPVTAADAIQGVLWEFDRDNSFSSTVSVQGAYGDVLSSIALPAAVQSGTPYFWRVNAIPETGSLASRHLLHSRGVDGVVFADSVSFSLCTASHLRLVDGAEHLLASQRALRVSSAGALAGNTASILIDGEEVLPYPGLDGYGVVVIDSVSFEITAVRIFTTRSSAAEADSLSAFLSSINGGHLVAIATAGDPRPNVDRFAPQIQRMGSAFITQLDDRGSWSLIGHPGAATGSVAEINLGRLVGRAVLDSTIIALPPVGTLRTPVIGPVHAWKQLRMQGEYLEGNLEARVLAIRTGAQDSLLIRSSDTLVDLQGIDAASFAAIRVEIDLKQQSLNENPVLRAVDLSLQYLPELAMNYQSVKLDRDSLEIGASPALRLGVVNAGESPAPPTTVQMRLVNASNALIESQAISLPSLRFLDRSDTLIHFSSLQAPGRYRLTVEVDPAHSIREQYRENNLFQLGFTVRGDTSSPELTLQIDGADPFDGDYVAARPEVLLSLLPGNGIPVTDPILFHFAVDDVTIPSSDPRVQFDAGAPGRAAQFRVSLELSNGEHVFRWNAVDMLGNPAFPEDRTVRVIVDADTRILQIYPYPSPFTESTDITFMLSGDNAPQEGELRFYTVAGRRIRNIGVPPGTLRIGFNTIRWDGRDEDGDECANGVYFYKLLVRSDDGDLEYVGRVARIR